MADEGDVLEGGEGEHLGQLPVFSDQLPVFSD